MQSKRHIADAASQPQNTETIYISSLKCARSCLNRSEFKCIPLIRGNSLSTFFLNSLVTECFQKQAALLAAAAPVLLIRHSAGSCRVCIKVEDTLIFA